MEIGIYITSNIIHHRELYLRRCRLFLAARESCATLFIEHHFPSVLWPLRADVDVWRITCSLVALALNIHVFQLHPEAEGCTQ